MCIGIIWNNSFLVGGRARAEARIDLRPLRTSHSTAHGAQVVWPLDYMGRAQEWNRGVTIWLRREENVTHRRWIQQSEPRMQYATLPRRRNASILHNWYQPSLHHNTTTSWTDEHVHSTKQHTHNTTAVLRPFFCCYPPSVALNSL